MSSWFLFIITIAHGLINLQVSGTVGMTQTECFEARELAVERIGRPIKNYQAVCIQVDDEQLPNGR